MKYEIITATTTRDLVNALAEYLDAGWRPIGGVSVCRSAPDKIFATAYSFAQAIIWDDE